MYYLLNKNKPLIKFELVEGLTDCICVARETYSELPIWIKDINSWIEQRNYAKHKKHLKQWLIEWGISDKKGFIEITHALGLNDTLWVKEEKSTLTWEKVNLYNNDFSDIAERTAFETGLKGLKLFSTSPEITAEGSFDKCWKRENGEIFVYKKGSYGFANSGLEPYSEYYASKLAKSIIGQDVLDYELTEFKGNLCTKSKLFTSEEEGFVPFYKYCNESEITMEKAFDFYKQKGFEQEFREMIVLDGVVLNADRHSGNFGFIIDNESFEIKRVAPIFDLNFSLLCRAMKTDLDNIDEYLMTQGHKMGGDYISTSAKLVNENISKNLVKHKKIALVPHNKYNLENDRIEKINTIIQKNIEEIINKSRVLKKVKTK